jgi:DNA topoisomerase VI subunit B
MTFQPAKTPDEDRRFLQIVATPRRVIRRKPKAKPQPKLTRVAFRVSRLMEFCTMKELQNQTGHSLYEWPLVVLKELMDNALDAAEEAEVAPVVSITVEPGSITIRDNGPGIKTPTIKAILDYTVRVSSREAYVSPTRGAQGNALKTVLAMGYVIDRWQGSTAPAGVTIIETSGVKHTIEFRVDHVNNEPRITHTTEPSPIDAGTKITVAWTPKWKWWEG